MEPLEVFPTNLNVAQSCLGAKLLTGSFYEVNLISGSDGWTSHRVGGKPDCITVQLDKPYRINHLKFTLLYTDEEGTYHIEVSVDGVEWKKVVDDSNVLWSDANQSLRFDPIEVKFIKLTGVNCKELTICSLEAMYSTSECEVIEGVPVATSNVTLTSKGATANGTNSEGCIDGDEDSRARLDDNHLLRITIPQPHWISSIRMLIAANGNNYTIESSPDGESWQPVCDEVLGNELQVWREFEFSRRIVKQFRMKMNEANTNCVSAFKGV